MHLSRPRIVPCAVIAVPKPIARPCHPRAVPDRLKYRPGLFVQLARPHIVSQAVKAEPKAAAGRRHSRAVPQRLTDRPVLLVQLACTNILLILLPCAVTIQSTMQRYLCSHVAYIPGTSCAWGGLGCTKISHFKHVQADITRPNRRPSPVRAGRDHAFWVLCRLECAISGENPNKGNLRISPENHPAPPRMPATRQPSARKRARKSTTAAKPPCTPLPPDASALLRTIESSADTAVHFVPVESVSMLVLVSKTMRAVLQQARLPASVQVSHIYTLCLLRVSACWCCSRRACRRACRSFTSTHLPVTCVCTTLESHG